MTTRELLGAAEEGEEDAEDLLTWQEHLWEDALHIVECERCVRLPSKPDVHDLELMRDFAEQVQPERIRDDLLRSVHGNGPSGVSKTPFAATVCWSSGTHFARQRWARSQ